MRISTKQRVRLPETTNNHHFCRHVYSVLNTSINTLFDHLLGSSSLTLRQDHNTLV